jgi:hypothetical protein
MKVQALLQFTGVKASLFPLNSRYRGLEAASPLSDLR